MGLKKARSPLPHDASPNSLKSKRQRHSMDRYVSMWASCVEKSVSPLPAPVVGTTEKENRIRGLPDFLESEMQGELPQAGGCGPSAETKPRPCSSPKSQPKRVPTPRKAAKKDTPPAVPKTTTETPHPVNAYERERDERIVRNKLMMESLRVTSAASALAKVAAASASDSKKVKVSQQSAKPRKPKVVPPRRPPSTRSTRNQATCLDEDPKFQSLAFENPREFGFGSRTKQNDGPSMEHSMSCAEWCDKHKLPKGPAMDGMFTGWVSESAVAKLGLAPTKEAHWATHAGAPVKPTGKETAKAFALRMMTVNPNAYFYRHNLPGEDTRLGEWAPHEIEHFVAVAKEFGAGDKWGLFASHVPHRVGYACSQIYRHKIIPNGLLLDDTFRVDERGRAVWVGKSRK